MNFSSELSTSTHPVSNSTNDVPVLSYIYVTVCSINVILGLPVHSCVLWLICMGKGSGIVAEFFTLNLAVCEIFFCLGCVLLIGGLNFPALSCASLFFIAVPIIGRPLINCIICVERYMAVLYPVFFLKCKPLRYRLACSAVIWVIVLIGAMLCWGILVFNNMYMFLCISLPLCSVLLFIQFCCCLTIFKALKDSGPGEKGKEREEANHIKRKAMIVILIITATMFIQYTPIYLIGILYFTSSVGQFGLYWCIVVVIWMMMAYVNPLLYLHRVRNL